MHGSRSGALPGSLFGRRRTPGGPGRMIDVVSRPGRWPFAWAVLPALAFAWVGPVTALDAAPAVAAKPASPDGPKSDPKSESKGEAKPDTNPDPKTAPKAKVPAGPERWEKTIAAYEEADKKSPPAEGGVVFVGSSSVRLWKLEDSFPGKGYLNRGFGGSRMDDAAHFAERLVVRYRPRTVVVYSGDNDLASGRKPEQILASTKELAAKVHVALPESRVLVISVKPSIARWKNIDNIRATNKLLAEWCATDKRLAFVDIQDGMMGTDGKPNPELFVKDGLHMSPAGYKVWTEKLRPFLETASGK